MRNFGIITVILFSLTLNSCLVSKSIQTSKMKSEFTIENDAIPPYFGKNKKTVIIGVLKGRNGYDKYLKSAFKKNFKGQYLLLTEKELKNPKYRDFTVYRYIFNYSMGTTRSTTYSDGMQTSVTYKRFFILDRITDDLYQSGAEFSFFKGHESLPS